MAEYTGVCPFYRTEQKGALYCEGCKLKFPDELARREFVYRYCGDVYTECPVYGFLERFYERGRERKRRKK